jgi:hypothetical protein
MLIYLASYPLMKGIPKKKWFNKKKTTKDYLGILLLLQFHDYNRLVYDYN